MYFEYIEGCLDGKNVHDAYLNEYVDEKFAAYLSILGRYSLYNEFDKPLYRVIVKSKYTIKGSLGNNYFRIILNNFRGRVLRFANQFNVAERGDF